MTDQYDDDDSDKKPRSDEFAKMLEESFQKSPKKLSPGDKIRSEILSIGGDVVFVSTGTMHDGSVHRREFLDKDGQLTVKVGDTVELYVIQARGSDIVLSPNKTAKNIADDLEDAFDKMLPVEGRVAEVCKGGFRVALLGNKLAFCPISQLDSKRIETPEEYIGRRFEFMITQFSEGGRNIVVSRRKLLDEQRDLNAGSFAEEHKPGEILQGTVTRMEKFGAFVELVPGVEGLVHISEIAWSRLETPQERLAIGQTVSAKILKVEHDSQGRLKISLSIKQAGEEPWANLPESVREGQVVTGKVTRCMKFGAFVEIAPGIEGLVPLGEMSHTKRVMRSDELFKEGDKIPVMIKEIRSGEHRILLSHKDAGEDPWSLVPHKFPVGSLVKGKVVRRESYGVFVQLEEGIVALFPKSRSADDAGFQFEKVKMGDELTLRVGEIRPDERRISLTVPGDESAEDWKSYKPQATGSFGTLGDKLKLAMEAKSGKKKS